MYDFTVCIPTYNRCELLSRAIDSVLNQTHKNFEILIIDDGSTDGTCVLASEYIGMHQNIKYVRKNNGGKYTALNLAFREANGVFFLILDSDDSLIETALDRMLKLWSNINVDEQELFCGIMGRCITLNGQKIGKIFPEEPYISSYVDFHYISGPYGDACECIRTDILRRYQFPEYEGEKFMAESVITDRIGLEYKLYCTNEIFKKVEYCDDGITRNVVFNKVSSIRATLEKYVDLLTCVFPDTKERVKCVSKLRVWSNYWRYVFHDRKHLGRRVQFKYSWISISTMFIGFLVYLIDRYKLKGNK